MYQNIIIQIIQGKKTPFKESIIFYCGTAMLKSDGTPTTLLRMHGSILRP